MLGRNVDNVIGSRGERSLLRSPSYKNELVLCATRSPITKKKGESLNCSICGALMLAMSLQHTLSDTTMTRSDQKILRITCTRGFLRSVSLVILLSNFHGSLL